MAGFCLFPFLVYILWQHSKVHIVSSEWQHSLIFLPPWNQLDHLWVFCQTNEIIYFISIAMMIPVQVSLFRSCSSIRSVIAAETQILSPRAAGDRPCQRWPQLQNPGQPSPRQSLTFCSASWCMVIQNLIYKSQRKIWIIKKKNNTKHFTQLKSFILTYYDYVLPVHLGIGMYLTFLKFRSTTSRYPAVIGGVTSGGPTREPISRMKLK